MTSARIARRARRRGCWRRGPFPGSGPRRYAAAYDDVSAAGSVCQRGRGRRLVGVSTWVVFALISAFLTSFLPIVNKRLLADTPVGVVAWGVNVLSLPILGFVALALYPVPVVDLTFWLGVLGSALLNLAATVASTRALQ